jgi:cobalt-zinc-cadmium efflux system protein
MLTDAAALGLALFALRIAARPPSRRASYGYARAEVIAAFVNALALLALVVFIVVEAVSRLLQPVPVAGSAVLAIALCGLAVNLATAWILSRATRTPQHARRAAARAVGPARLRGGHRRRRGHRRDGLDADRSDPLDRGVAADPALDVAADGRVDRRADGGRAVAPGLRRHRTGTARSPGIAGVHDLHVWQMSAARTALSAHLALSDGREWPTILAAAQKMLAERYAIEHTTLQPSWPAPPRYVGRRVIPISGPPQR